MSSIMLDSMPATPHPERSYDEDLQRPRPFSNTPLQSSDSIESLNDATSSRPRRAASPFTTGANTPNRSYSHFGQLSSMSSTMTLNSTPFFQSRRKRKEEISRPWMDSKKTRRIGTMWHWLLPLIGAFIGIAGAGVQIFFASTKFANFDVCPVLDADFSSGIIDPKIWQQEVEVGGFGNGEFEMTTTSPDNSFVKDGNLVIKPTLQDENLINTDNVLNLLDNGCTSTSYYSCVAATNTTNGTIVPPVRSARLTTKGSASIKYGRVEVVAKLPAGDWMWPAIWMLPTDSVYGAWPASGEIDLMESRGNNASYTQGGRNVVHQTTHWGPTTNLDQAKVTTAGSQALHGLYSGAFHTYGLQWTEKYIFTYIDKRVRQILYQPFKKPLWESGNFPVSYGNGTAIQNPWSNATNAAPFDQRFYLILNVAVGGTNGWFGDGVGGKPWTDGDAEAKLKFWEARGQWLPTWGEDAQMEIKSVKMWQKKGYEGC